MAHSILTSRGFSTHRLRGNWLEVLYCIHRDYKCLRISCLVLFSRGKSSCRARDTLADGSTQTKGRSLEDIGEIFGDSVDPVGLPSSKDDEMLGEGKVANEMRVENAGR